MPDVSLFTDRGMVREDLTAEELGGLSPEMQEAAAATIIACRSAQDQDDLVNNLRKEWYEKVSIETAATELDQQTNVAVDPTFAARCVIAANTPGMEKPKPPKLNSKVRSARDVAAAATVAIRQTFNEAQKLQREVTSPARAASVVAWIKLCQPSEGRQMAQAREYQMQGSVQRAANVAHHGSPEPAKPVMAHLTPMELAGPNAKIRQRRPMGSMVAVKPLGPKID